MDPVEALADATPQFEEAYTVHRLRVFNLCRYLLGSSDTAQDATQEVFLRAQERFSAYDPSRPLSSWLTAISRGSSEAVTRWPRVTLRGRQSAHLSSSSHTRS